MNIGDLIDRALIEVDHALRTVAAPARARRPYPGESPADTELSADAQALSAGLMRVNHAGEIAAQALYRGQAAVCRDELVRRSLLAAAEEEHDHLAWCEQRVKELGENTSLLAPLWYAGSFGIGALAGLAGERTSLGFLAETERQVEAHLEDHLQRLPENDAPSRRICEQMRADEIKHGQHAAEQGGAPLPDLARRAMAVTSKVMTTLARRV